MSGFYVDSIGNSHGFLLSGSVFTTLDVTGSASTQILGINEAGQIVGFYTNAAEDTVGFIGTPLATVPEPGVALLLAIGTSAWLTTRRRSAVAPDRDAGASMPALAGL